MTRRHIASGSTWETRYGYSRAVVDGRHVYVTGTAPIMPDDSDPPADAYGQAHRCLDIIVTALQEAGARPEDVVRTRFFITDPSYAEEVLRAHQEVFGAARPANTGIVCTLIDPRWLVEIEAEALLE